ncbi:MAG: SDR family NAD(P)-dependent oxidoreductase [Planctomycetaceae bacterium]
MPATFANLTGLTAVVTGSSTGIGRAIALELARGGADLVIHCRRETADAQAVAAECRKLGRRAAVLTSDFSSTAALAPFVDRAWEELGPPQIWVNNAGADVLTGPDAKRSYEGKLQSLLDVDVRATVVLSRLAGQRLRAGGGGTIVNIGWDQADRGMEGDSGELFAAAKNAIMGFTRSLAASLAPEVRVNCIAPGWIRTAWGERAGDEWQQRVLRETPLQRWGTPQDIAWLARFLASREAAYLTGQVVNANGGAIR